MQCPACSSERVYHSQPRSFRENALKQLFPIAFYRCHECDWRRLHLRRWKLVGSYLLTILAYAATAVLAVAIGGGIVLVILMFVGGPKP